MIPSPQHLTTRLAFYYVPIAFQFKAITASRSNTKLENHPLSAVLQYQLSPPIASCAKDTSSRQWAQLQLNVASIKGLHLLEISPDSIKFTRSRRVKWEGHVARTWQKKILFTSFVRKAEENRPLRRLRLRWVNNIKMDLTEIGLVLIGFMWLRLGTDRALLPILQCTFGLPTIQGIS